MALWDPEIECPLCGLPTGDRSDLIIGFTCVGSYDPDVCLDDAVAHSACIDQWVRRDAFVASWNGEAARNDRSSPYYLEVTSDGHVVTQISGHNWISCKRVGIDCGCRRTKPSPGRSRGIHRLAQEQRRGTPVSA